MRKVFAYGRLVVIFVAIYVILNENLTFLTVGLGIVSAVAAIWITNEILEIDYVEMFHINIFLLLTYFWIIIRDTYTMGFHVIKKIFANGIKPNFISYRTQLNDEYLTSLLANAITMPPGAIVVDREGKDMNVLTIGFDSDEFRRDTSEKIERLLRKFDSTD